MGIAPPEIDDSKALAKLEQAKHLTISSNEGYVEAGALRQSLKGLEDEINRTFDHLIEQAFRHHRTLVAEKKRHFEPIEQARVLIKGAMIKWDEEKERERRAEQERIEAENRKKAEDEALRKAEAAEKAGDKKKAEAILNAPVTVSPVILPKATPKVPGHVVRVIWDAEVVDFAEFLKYVVEHTSFSYVQVNWTTLRQLAQSTKGTMTFPGIRFFSRKV